MISFTGPGWLAVVALALPLPQRPDTVPVPLVVRAAYEQGMRSPSGAPGEGYWQIWPEYELRGRLDPERATVHGSGTVSFVNASDAPLDGLVLRLDQNRFRGGASAPVSTRGIDLRRLEIDGEPVDLAGPAVTGLTTTIVRVRLTRPLEPGQRLRLRVVWDYEVPLDERSLALRQGRWGNEVFQIAQWYPRLAMYDDLGGWDVAEHNGSREFFNPFAHFRVRLQVPTGWLVGATGTLTNPVDVLGPTALRRLEAARASDTTLFIVRTHERGEQVLAPSSDDQTWTFEADSVSDFAWGASAGYAWAVSSRMTPAHRVLVHALLTPRHREDLLAASATAAEIIATLSTRVMPYAWDTHTLLDGPEGGMEYPSLTMSHGDARISHELGHQWFPMMVGSDETRFDFLDEGFATFYAAVTSGGPVARSRPERSAMEPLLVGNDLRTPRPVLGYGRGSRMLHTLAARVGEERLLSALRAYALEWRFKHPSPWDFMASMERFLGEELDSFWLEWLFDTAAIRP